MSDAQEIAHGIIVLASDVIKEDQNGIKTALSDLDVRVHNNAIQCMIHAEIHGDTSLMRRLLIDIIPLDKHGYNRAGLINWIRKWSPMELTKDNINLSGVDENGAKRPFKVEEANKTPFYMDKANRATVARPVFRENLTSKLSQAIREFEAACANTTDQGLPKDPAKPYYDGVQMDKAKQFFDNLKAETNNFLASYTDNKRDIYNAKDSLRKSLNGLDPTVAKEVVSSMLAPQPEAPVEPA